MSTVLERAVIEKFCATASGVETRGRSSSLGATVFPDGVNFSVFSRGASAVELLLFDREDDARPSRVISIDPAVNCTYHYWHVFVAGVRSGQIYGYRVHGPWDPANGMRFDPTKVLVDPYSRSVVIPKSYNRDDIRNNDETTAAAMKSVVVDTHAYDWERDSGFDWVADDPPDALRAFRQRKNMRAANSVAIVCLTAIVVAGPGCGGKVRYPNYYVLNVPTAPAPSDAETKPLLGSVAVWNFSAPSFLRAGPLVYRESAEQINFCQYHRWALDPRISVTNALLQDLQARGLFVSVAQYDGRDASDFLLTGRLDQPEEIDNGRDVRIAVGLPAQLMNLKTGGVVGRNTASDVRGLEQRTLPGVVAAMSQAVQKSVDHLVSSMQKNLEPKSVSSADSDIGQQ